MAIEHLRAPGVEEKRRAGQAAYWQRYRDGLEPRLPGGPGRGHKGRRPIVDPKTHEQAVRAGKASAAARAARKAQTNGHTPDVTEAIGSLTAEQIVGAIQARIDDLTMANFRLASDLGRLSESSRVMQSENESLRDALDEARLRKEALDRDVFELQKENRQLAADLRVAKEKHSGGLRLFRTGS